MVTDKNGRLDTGFNPSGLSIDAMGNFISGAGYVGALVPSLDVGVAALTFTGLLDRSFNPSGASVAIFGHIVFDGVSGILIARYILPAFFGVDNVVLDINEAAQQYIVGAFVPGISLGNEIQCLALSPTLLKLYVEILILQVYL